MDHAYFVRYGLMAQVGRFAADSADYRRGQRVVIQSRRGTELGEVLVPAGQSAAGFAALPKPSRILRAAGPDDLARAREVERDRDERYLLCDEVFRKGIWPIELVDVEPMLDDRRTVLSYLGPHHLDAEGLISVFRSVYGIDVVLEPVGRDASVEETEPEPEPSCGSCASGGGCGEGGGCHSGGCDDCGVKKLLATRRRAGSVA